LAAWLAAGLAAAAGFAAAAGVAPAVALGVAADEAAASPRLSIAAKRTRVATEAFFGDLALGRSCILDTATARGSGAFRRLRSSRAA
jgi:hypothetical protein